MDYNKRTSLHVPLVVSFLILGKSTLSVFGRSLASERSTPSHSTYLRVDSTIDSRRLTAAERANKIPKSSLGLTQSPFLTSSNSS